MAVLGKTGRPIAEPVFLALLLGLALPGLALLVLPGLPTIPPSTRVPADVRLLVEMALYVTLFLSAEGPIVTMLAGSPADPRFTAMINALVKLVVFVAAPLAAWRAEAKHPLLLPLRPRRRRPSPSSRCRRKRKHGQLFLYGLNHRQEATSRRKGNSPGRRYSSVFAIRVPPPALPQTKEESDAPSLSRACR